MIDEEVPDAVFLGGDLLPGVLRGMTEPDDSGDFLGGFLLPVLHDLRDRMGGSYPELFVILGNDDGRIEETAMRDAETAGIWHYVHGRRDELGPYAVYGYSFVPPTPFLFKDWERYDVSRFADPGCVHPGEGIRTVPVPENEVLYSTISEDLEALTGDDDLSRAIMLFHSPPYRTGLDRAALDGRKVDHAPLDVHVGSIAVLRMIRNRRPLITLHGHVHESARLTGRWMEKMGATHMFGAAHDGPELALVRFDPERPEDAVRELL